MSTGVTVLLFGPVASSLRRRRVHIEASDVHEVVRAVDAMTGGAFAPWVDACRVFVNGEPASEARLARLLAGDEVAFLPPSSGG
jgi:molybdopterin converting factor small subunit